MSMCQILTEIDAEPWIKHFEEQAKKGNTARSRLNKHFILVESGKRDTEVQHPQPLPPVVSPVQQSVDQAKEEVKREKEEGETQKALGISEHCPVLKRKAKEGVFQRAEIIAKRNKSVRRGKKKKILFSDIFN